MSNFKVKKQEYKRRKNEVKNIEVASNITRVKNKPRINEAIGDTGTTWNFVLPGTPVNDIKVAENSIEIGMPNGAIERSTHTCYLRIPGLPKQLREAHIVLGCPIPLWYPLNNMQRRMCHYFQRQNLWSMVQRRISTYRKRDWTRRTVDITHRRLGRLRWRETRKRNAESPQHCHGNSAHIAVQAAKGKIHASNFLCNATCHVRKGNK